jgi:hypothetical protein
MSDLGFDPNTGLGLGDSAPASTPTTAAPASADTGSVSSIAPTTNNSGQIPLDQATRGDDLIYDNVLNRYIDAIYNVSLALISPSAAAKIRTAGEQDAQINPDEYIIFASTGDVETGSTAINETIGSTSDLNYYGDYYNIKSVSFRSVLGHVPQNPLVSVTFDGKMRIFQPMGFSFREDLDDMALALGWGGDSPNQFVYRLEFWFSGYDPVSGAWVSHIPIPCPRPRGGDDDQLNSIVYYLTITDMEAKVTHMGTEYDLSYQTISHTATRGERILMHQDNVPTIVKGQKGEPFRIFLANLAQRLSDQIYHDTMNKIRVNIQFVGFKQLLDEPFIDDVSVDISTGVTLQQSSGSYGVTGKSVDLYTFLVHAMHSLNLTRALRLQEPDTKFNVPGVEWNIRTNILDATDFDSDINAEKTFTFQYIFEPHLHFRNRLAEPSVRNLQVDHESQNRRAQEIIDFGMLYRVYSFLFTNDNSEVIDCQFRYKFFYFAPFPYPGTEVFLRGHGHDTNNLSLTQDLQEEKTEAAGSEIRDPVTPTLNFVASPGQSRTLSEVLNIPTPQSASGTKQPGQIFGPMDRGPAMPQTQGTKNDKYATKNLIAQDMYLRYDMLGADLTVRFDPTWLLNPYMSGRDSTSLIPLDSVGGVAGADSNFFVYAHTDRVIFLRAFAPNQAAYMNPNVTTSFIKDKGNPMLGGFYAVIHVDNIFDGGKFYQKLNLYKYEHLNYFNSLGTSAPISQNAVSQGSDTTGTSSAQAQITPDPNAGGFT